MALAFIIGIFIFCAIVAGFATHSLLSKIWKPLQPTPLVVTSILSGITIAAGTVYGLWILFITFIPIH